MQHGTSQKWSRTVDFMLFWWFLVNGTLVLAGNQRGGNGEYFGTFAHSVHSLRGSPLSPSLLSNQTGHCVHDANINPAPPHPRVSNNDPRKGKQNSAQVILLHYLDNCLNLPLFFAVGQLTTCVFPL